LRVLFEGGGVAWSGDAVGEAGCRAWEGDGEVAASGLELLLDEGAASWCWGW
jgi:hypothetical protein